MDDDRGVITFHQRYTDSQGSWVNASFNTDLHAGTTWFWHDDVGDAFASKFRKVGAGAQR